MDYQGRKTLSVVEMGKWLGIKKVDAYWLVHKNYFDIVQVAGRMRVVMESFEYWYAGQIKYKKITGEPPGERLKQESYSPREIAEILGVSEDVSYSLISRYSIPTITVDCWMRVRREDFEHWYAGQAKYRNREDRQRDADIEKSSITMPEMARLLDVTRSCVYYILKSEMGRKYLNVVVIAGRKRITKDSFAEWYRSQRDYLMPKDREGKTEEKKRRSYMEGLTGKAAPKGRYKKTKQNKKKVERSTNPEYLTVQEAATIANATPKKILYWVSRNKFPYVRASSVIRINKIGFEKYLNEKKGGK